MRYLLKQKIWCFGNDFRIQDEAARDCFIVDGAAFSFGEKLRFLDLQGNEVAFIRERLLSWGPAFEIYRSGQLYATVKKHLFTFFHCKFEVDGPGSNDFEAGGDFTDHEYQITGPLGPVAHVSKRWFALSDTYGVDISDGQDDVLLLATAVVIDLICHQDKKKH
jgi:uncharacterized protein YxjI